MRLCINWNCNFSILVDGGYGKWGNWQECNYNCAAGSLFKRTRPCNSPTPALGGSNCNSADGFQETSIGKVYDKQIDTVDSNSTASQSTQKFTSTKIAKA